MGGIMTDNLKKKLRNNKGFSLVEIMVVIAIMMILVGIAALSYNVVTNANVSKAANTLNSAFSTAKTTCIAKGADEGTLTIKVIDSRMYYYIGSAADGTAATASQMKQVSNATTKIALAGTYDAIGGTALTDGYVVQYAFKPSGAMYTISGGSDVDFAANACVDYLFSNKKRLARAYIYPETGRHDVSTYNY